MIVSSRITIEIKEDSEQIHYAESELRGPEIIVGPVAVELVAAFGAGIRVETGVDPSYGELRLKVPVVGKYPVVAISKAETGTPALVAAVGEIGKVAAQEFDIVADVAEVVFTADSMESEEMACEAFTEPITEFGLHKPVLPQVAVDVPEIKLAGDIESPFRFKTKFEADIWR